MNNDWLTVRVSARRQEARDIAGFDLVSIDGGTLPPFTAGSHIYVEAAPGVIRQYSLCNSPSERHRYQIAVLRESNSRGGSIAVHKRLLEGSTLRISAPKNQFPLDPTAKHSILLGGGIGVTPLISMAEILAANDASFEMHYCVRSRERAAFVSRLSVPPLVQHVCVHFDDGGEAQRLDLRDLLTRSSDATHLYICGPEGFMEWIAAETRLLEWPSAQLHREYFAAPLQPNASARGSFKVRVASTGMEFEIPPERSVVQILGDAGIVIPTFCEQGVCGTCLTRVIEGTPQHCDAYLSEAERARNDAFIPCCSRALSDCLVLDL